MLVDSNIPVDYFYTICLQQLGIQLKKMSSLSIFKLVTDN